MFENEYPDTLKIKFHHIDYCEYCELIEQYHFLWIGDIYDVKQWLGYADN